jgi:beta-lactamase class A
MHELGLKQTHVAHTLREIFEDMLPSADPDQDRHALARWEAKHGVRRDGFSYSLGADNNVGTPREMTRLLEMIFTAEILDRAACDGMLGILLKQQYYDRLPRFLPSGTPIAHKTGTFSGVRNDCGIIYANSTSRVIVSALATWDYDAVRGNPLAEWERFVAIDTAFGHIGLAAYEAFV